MCASEHGHFDKKGTDARKRQPQIAADAFPYSL